MKKLIIVVFILFFNSLSSLLFAQKLVERTVAVFDFAPFNNSEGDYASIFADTIAIELERIGFLVLDTSTIRKNFKNSLIDEQAMIQFARENKADVIVMGFYVIEGNTIYIGLRAIDIFTGLVAVSIIDTGKGGVAIFDTIDEISMRVAKKIREALQPLPESEYIVYREITKVQTTVIEEVIEEGTPVTITLKAKDEGAEVFSGDTLLGTIENGMLAINTKEGANLAITITKPGFYSQSLVIKVSGKNPTVSIQQLRPIAINELVVSMSHDRPLGLTVLYSRAIIPDTLFYGGQSGFMTIPLDFDFGAPEHDSNAFFEVPLFLTLTFYPLGMLAPTFPLQPFLRAYIGGEVYFANFPNAFNFSAINARGMIALGMTIFPHIVAITGEIQLGSPAFVSWGTLRGFPPVIHLSIGARYTW